MKTHEEWFVGIMPRYELEENGKKARYWNARFMYPGVESISDRYCKSEEEARKVLEYAYKVRNGNKRYNSNGERYETTEAAPGIGVSTVHTKQTDRSQEIVKHIIRKRTVTDWETIAE